MTPCSKDAVYQALRHRLVIQDLKPGARLSEKALMQEYGIGKTPLREVFFRLQRDGLIRRFPRSGTIVAPIDFKELRDIAEVRLSLEGLAAALACRRMTPAVLERMREMVQSMQQELPFGPTEAFLSAETALHATLYSVAGNDKLQGILTEQQSLFARLLASAERSGLALSGQVEDWRELCKALAEKHESRARELNLRHFQGFYNHLRLHFY